MERQNILIGELSVESVVELIVLCQCDSPGFDNILSLEKIELAFGETG